MKAVLHEILPNKKNTFLPSIKEAAFPICDVKWAQILNSVYQTPAYLITLDDGIKGWLFLYLVKDLYGNKQLHSFKYGIYAESDSFYEVLIERARKLADEINCQALLICSGLTKLKVDLIETEKKTLLLDLPSTQEDMWEKFRDKTRNSIRKAEKESITIERGNKNLRDFYQGYSERMFEKRVAIHPYEYFENMFKLMPDNTELITAKYQGKYIGAVLVQYNREGAIYLFNGTNSFIPTSPNQLLLWEMSKFCIEKQIKVLDMSESSEGSGVFKFKKNFGAVPYSFYYYTLELFQVRRSLLGKVKNRIVNNLIQSNKLSFSFLRKLLVYKRSHGRLQ